MHSSEYSGSVPCAPPTKVLVTGEAAHGRCLDRGEIAFVDRCGPMSSAAKLPRDAALRRWVPRHPESGPCRAAYQGMTLPS
jgi:hypothetical protein